MAGRPLPAGCWQAAIKNRQVTIKEQVESNAGPLGAGGEWKGALGRKQADAWQPSRGCAVQLQLADAGRQQWRGRDSGAQLLPAGGS